MQSQWTKVTEDFKSREGIYGGIYTENPLLIGQSIKRPLTPFVNHTNFSNSFTRLNNTSCLKPTRIAELSSSFHFSQFES